MEGKTDEFMIEFMEKSHFGCISKRSDTRRYWMNNQFDEDE